MGQSVPSSLMGDNPGNRPFSSKKGERFRDRERKGFSDIKKEPRERPERPLPLKKRSRSRTPKRGDRSGSPRRRMRVVPRYVVQIPKLSFNLQAANVVTLKSRYSSMYVPSDFFKANFTWMDAFPLTRPFQLGRNCEFHVLHKDVESINTSDALLDPPDADHSFNAKVMLLSCPELEDLYHKSCSLSEDAADVQENFVHPTRLIHFLVGVKGKNETMAIGGAWSPSQDGLNPDEDPKVLIKTAIRTTKALTGIDLSACTQWYRFAEVRYLRPEEIHKGKHLPTRVETTVIFFPDVWSCSPSRLEWASLQTAYKKQLQKKIAAISDGPKDTSSQEEDEDTENIEVRDPTHFSQLDPKAMKIIDLRRELEARTLSNKGLKSQLIARLTKSLKMEQEKEESEDQVKEETSIPMEEEVLKNLEEEKTEEKKKEEEEKKKKDEREKVSLERKYALPENPAILVHPNPLAKSGKFDCAVMSLSVLLDYRPEDNKEHSFEVSLFAELFNEMLMRDFGFEIYKSLVRAPEKKEEEKKDKEKEKEKDKDKDKEKEKDKKSDEKSTKEPTPKKRKKDEETKDSKKDGEKNDRKAYVVKKEADDKSEEKKEEDEEESDDKKKKKDKKKYFTRFPALLLSFTYFDQNHTGYLIDKDVEEIIHTIGLQLSRAQVKKLAQKSVSRDSIHYRKLTDKPLPGQVVDKEEESKEIKIIDTEMLALGNAEYDPDYKDSKSGSSNRTQNKGEDEVLTGMINYKGSVLDIESLLDRLEKSEKTRLDMEKEMQKLSKDRDAIKTNLETKEESGQKLKEELKQVKQKLCNQEKLTNFSESASKKYISALMLSKDHLTTMLDTVSAALDEKDIKKEDILKKEEEKVVVKKEKVENGD
ncbi:cell division cycle and apoptosis regulator protein 1-like isoform X2 [Mytilus galloprovincialis]